MKVYVRQIPWDIQESPLYLGAEFWPDDVAVFGNPDLESHKFPAAELLDNLDDAADQLDRIQDGGGWYNTATEMLNDLLPRQDGKSYNTRQVHKWKSILSGDYDDEENTAAALSLVTGTLYRFRTIRGVCQGDWQILYYPDNWDANAVSTFEAEYFNTGSEWMIHDDDTIPESPEDISGYCCYIHGWSTEEIRKELSEIAGCKPEDLVLWEYKGDCRVPVWEKAG